jgi:hypothetical protein
VIGQNPVTLQLRYLQTLREIGGSQNSTVVFPMPIDLVRPMLQALGQGDSGRPATSAPAAPATHENGALEPGDAHPGLNPAPPEATVRSELEHHDQLEHRTDPPRTTP